MAVPEGPTEKRYTGNGVTNIFTIPFLLLAATDLDVFINGVQVSSGYTLTGVGNPTSTITFTVAPASLADIYLQLDVPFERLNDYQENGDFLSSTVNRDFDRIWQALKQLLRWSNRSLRLGNSDVDGAGWYRAKGNGIRDLRDPIEVQDAATRGWSISFLTALVDSVTGIINTTTGIFYDGGTLFDYLKIGVARTVDNVAALKALSGSRNRRAFALGFNDKGDGGGGDYFAVDGDTTSLEIPGVNVIGNDGTRWRLQIKGPLSLKQCGAKGIGASFDDSAAWNACKLYASHNCLEMYVPPVAAGLFYNVMTSDPLDECLVIRGDVGGMVNKYSGLQEGGSIIHYGGTGDLFGFDTVQAAGKRGIEGALISDLILIGTASAKSCFRVGQTTDVGDGTKVKSNVGMRNVYIGNFSHGRGLNINWCFSNQFDTVVIQNCGVTCSLYYAHGTRFIGGNQEQSLVGLDVRISYGVSSYGTVIQGFDQTRQVTFGLAVPSDFFPWSGWDGSGTTGASRTTPTGYAGVALRNLGSKVDMYGNYWEYNNYNALTESDSHTSFHGGIVGLDSITKSFIQIGIGGVKCNDIEFQGGSHVGLQGVFQTERNYMAPCDIGPTNIFAASIPQNKIFTGPQNHVGSTARYNPAGFEIIQHDYNTFVTYGQSQIPDSGGAVGNFDLFPHMHSNRGRHVHPTPTTINYTFVDLNSLKALPGAPLQLHVLAAGPVGQSVITFSGTYFRAGASSYTLPAGNQIIFDFEFSNGFWIMKCTPVVTAI